MTTELLGSVTADTEDANFLASNLLDDRPKNYWKSGGSNIATLTAVVGAGSDQVAIFNTNAITASISIQVAAVEQEAFSIDLSSPHSHNRLWQSYTKQMAAHTIVITLIAAAASAIYAGVLRAGTGLTLRNPNYGISEGRKDFSIIKELNNGAYYIRKRNIVRTFNLSFLSARSSADYYAFSAFYDNYGPEPVAILLAEGIDDLEWAIFGHIIQPFSANHEYYSHSNVSYEITEAV
jgi:hypothetical protein